MAALLAAGAHVDGVSGEPPIFYAAEKRELDAVRLLCDNGASLAITLSRGGGPQETVLAMLMRLELAWLLRFPGRPLHEAVIDELRARNAPL